MDSATPKGMCCPSEEGWLAQGASGAFIFSAAQNQYCSGHGFCSMFAMQQINKFSENILLELPKPSVLNPNEAIQKLKQDANLAKHASFTKTRN